MDSREESHSVWDEFQDPRGTPIITERTQTHKKEDMRKYSNMEGKRQKINGSYYTDDNITAHGDVIMWDLDDVDIQHTGHTSDHLTRRMTTTPSINILPKETGKIPTSPTLPNLAKKLALGGIIETKPNPQRPITSPKDARFRDIFPNPELKLQMTNRLGKTNAGGAFVIDDNITMYGDVMMLDLDSEDEGHSPRTAVEKFSQLTETPVDVIKPVNTRKTTTGIRHLMAIRNQELNDLPNSSGIDSEKKRMKKTRKSKQSKIKEEVACGSEYQNPDEQKCCSISTCISPEVDINTNSEKKQLGFLKMVGYQMGRLGAYIQRKLVCH